MIETQRLVLRSEEYAKPSEKLITRHNLMHVQLSSDLVLLAKRSQGHVNEIACGEIADQDFTLSLSELFLSSEPKPS